MTAVDPQLRMRPVSLLAEIMLPKADTEAAVAAVDELHAESVAGDRVAH